MLRVTGAFLIVGAFISTSVFAQGSAVITGTVLDAASKNPVPDVVVTATSPSLQGEQIVVTDATGLYRIPQLPSGVYTLRYEKESFKPFSRDGITIRQDVTVRVNIEILPDTLTEEVVVVGRPPTIDVGSTTTGVNVSSDFIRNIAVVNPGARGGAARSFESLATIAPGAHADTYGVSISGTTSNENQYIIDGVSVNDPGFGVNATPLTIEFVSEVNVISGGYLPEYGRATGGVMSVITKSGSNEFHGSVFGNITPGALQGDVAGCDFGVEGWFGHFNCGRQVQSVAQTINTKERLWNLGDFGVEVGGPIMKDKLWFFVGFAPSYTRNSLTRTLRVQETAVDPVTGLLTPVPDANGNPTTTLIPGTEKRYFADQSTYQFIGKLTYLISQDHNLAVSVSGTPTSSGGENEFAIDPRTGGTEVGTIIGNLNSLASQYQANSFDVSAKLSSAFMDKKVLLDVTLGYHNQTHINLPYDGSAVGSTTGLASVPHISWIQPATGLYWPLAYFENLEGAAAAACEPGTQDVRRSAAFGRDGVVKCPVTNYRTGGPGFLSDSKFSRIQGKAIATYLLNAAGHHVLKGGIDIETASMDNTRAYSGRVFYNARGWSPARPGLGVAPGADNIGPTRYDESRAYAQMRGPDDPDYLTSLHKLSSSLTTGGFLQDSWNVLDLVTLNIGVRYDAQTMTGEGITAINFANQISPRIGVIYDFTGSGRSKLFANYARYYENALLDMIDRAGPGGEPSLATFRVTNNGCNPNVMDPTAAANVELCRDSSTLSNLAALVGYNAMENPNQYVYAYSEEATSVDPAIKPQSSDEIMVGGEYEVFQDARAGATYTKRYLNDVVEDVSLDEATTYVLTNPGAPGTIGSVFPAATRNYDAVTVYLNKNFSDLWLAQVSYTWSKLEGNYAGLFRPETGQLDPNINSTFDLISLLDNGTGPLPFDRNHSIKAFAAKEFVFGGNMSVNLGMTYTTRSGTALNVYGRHSVYGLDEVFILPRGSAGRMPWTHNIDTHIGFSYKLTKDSMVTLSADIFNLFNFQQEVARSQRYTTSNVNPIKDGTKEDLAGLETVDGEEPVLNANYGNTTAYQAARSIRFGARVTF